MKVLFVPSRYKNSFSCNSIKIKELPKIIGLITTIQYTNSLNKIKDYLEKNKKRVLIAKRSKSEILEKGQILGCDVSAAVKIQNKVQAFLYIGSGKFHPLQIALSLNKQKPIFLFNPSTEEFNRLNEKEIQKYKNRKRGQKLKFLSSNTYGILVSTKPGQNRLKQAIALKNKLEKEKKKAYIFMFNTLDINQLENWPNIKCWINTACPGLSLENPFVWIGDIKIKK